MINRPFPTKLNIEPLVEAVFEMRFNSNNPAASSIMPGLLFQNLDNIGPEIERLPAAEIPSQIRLTQPNLRFQPLLRLNWGDYYIFVGDSVLSLVCKMPYQGWTSFKEKINTLVNSVKSVNLITSIEQHALKYSDLIEGVNLSEQIKRLDMSIRLGNIEIKSEQFHLRVEHQRDGFLHVLQIAPLTTVTMITQERRTGIFVDVDTINQHQPMEIDLFVDEINYRLDRMHDSNKAIFFECLTSETIEYLGATYE